MLLFALLYISVSNNKPNYLKTYDLETFAHLVEWLKESETNVAKLETNVAKLATSVIAFWQQEQIETRVPEWQDTAFAKF